MRYTGDGGVAIGGNFAGRDASAILRAAGGGRERVKRAGSGERLQSPAGFADDISDVHMVSRFFQPSRVGVLLLLAILAVQVGLVWRTRTLCALGPDRCRALTTHRIGLPVVAELSINEQANGTTARTSRFYRLNAVMMLVGMYSVAMPLAALLSEWRVRGRPRLGGQGFEVVQLPPAAAAG